jgi:AraC-like DNA-binding protein
VAYATGFTNLSHFSASFREMHGMTPKEYMNAHLHGNSDSNSNSDTNT